MDKILRVGVVGCGRIFNSHALSYPEHPNTVLIGFYDRIRGSAKIWKQKMDSFMEMVYESAKDLEDGPEDKRLLEKCKIYQKEAKIYENMSDLLENIDILDISTPNYAHAPYALWALSKGISVMSEKPPARCSLETQWICEAIKNTKDANAVNYQLNENFFWQTNTREIKNLINSGIIGKIQKISTKFGHGRPSWGWNNHFINPSLSGGGCLSDMGTHAIGCGYGIIGNLHEIKNVQSLSMKTRSEAERTIKSYDGVNEYYMQKYMVEDNAHITVFLTPGNDAGEFVSQEIEWDIEASWSKTFEIIEIHGEKGALIHRKDDKMREYIAVYLNGNNPTNENPDKEILLPAQGRDPHQLEVIDFLNKVSAEPPLPSYVNENWAHKIQTIISGAYLSNYKAFNTDKEEGPIVTKSDLDDFYAQFKKNNTPKEILIEEIVFTFMSPFTGEYFS